MQDTKNNFIEKEVAAFAHDFEKQVKEGKYLSGEKLTYKDITERWQKEWAADHLKDGGAQYFDMIQRYAYPSFGMMKISKIMPLHIQDLIQQIKDKELSPVTIRKIISSINSVFRYAYRLKIIQENPCDRVELPKLAHDKELHYWDVKQAKAFLKALGKTYTITKKAHDRIDDTGKPYHVEAYTAPYTLPLMHQLYFTLAIYGGFRRGEICALTWKDIDFENHTVSINKAIARRKNGQIVKEPKTAAGIRIVNLPKVCFDMLKQWQYEERKLRFKLGSAWEGSKDFEDTFIFIQDTGSLMDISTVGKRFYGIIDRFNDSCDNPSDKLPYIRPHDLRHTAATLLVASGCDYATISHRLGHSKVSVTLDIYSHPLPENDIAASDTLERLLATS